MKEKEREIQKLKEEHHLALSRISHEIRNPVTLINSSMQLIEAEHPEVLSFDLWDDMKKICFFSGDSSTSSPATITAKRSTRRHWSFLPF
ncbi:MAG: hypothetical protein ACLR2E_15065 [Lachnospiraceae bacterium]